MLGGDLAQNAVRYVRYVHHVRLCTFMYVMSATSAMRHLLELATTFLRCIPACF